MEERVERFLVVYVLRAASTARTLTLRNDAGALATGDGGMDATGSSC